MNTEKNNVLVIGKGPPVLLLHSAMSSKLQWYRLMQSMRQEYSLIAVDFYGCGDSPFPTNPGTFSLSDEIELVESLIGDILPRDEPFHVVGHSYGGAVGLRFCYKVREKIRSLTLFEPVAYHLLPEREEVLTEIFKNHEVVRNFTGQGKYSEAAEYFIDYWNGKGTFSSYPKEVRELLSEASKKLPLGFQALINEPLSLEDYSRLDVPVCLMAGRQSPPSSRRIAELLPGHLKDCRSHWVEGAHMAPLLQPEQVNPIIETFIRSITRGLF